MAELTWEMKELLQGIENKDYKLVERTFCVFPLAFSQCFNVRNSRVIGKKNLRVLFDMAVYMYREVTAMLLETNLSCLDHPNTAWEVIGALASRSLHVMGEFDSPNFYKNFSYKDSPLF